MERSLALALVLTLLLGATAEASTGTPYCMQTKPTSVAGCTAALFVPDRTAATGIWTTTDIPHHASLGAGPVFGIYIYTHGVGMGPSTFSVSVPFGTLCLAGFLRSPAVVLPTALPGACNVGPMLQTVSGLSSSPIAPGDGVNVQFWYRDPTPALPGNANLSNAVFYTAF